MAYNRFHRFGPQMRFGVGVPYRPNFGPQPPPPSHGEFEKREFPKSGLE